MKESDYLRIEDTSAKADTPKTDISPKRGYRKYGQKAFHIVQRFCQVCYKVGQKFTSPSARRGYKNAYNAFQNVAQHSQITSAIGDEPMKPVGKLERRNPIEPEYYEPRAIKRAHKRTYRQPVYLEAPRRNNGHELDNMFDNDMILGNKKKEDNIWRLGIGNE